MIYTIGDSHSKETFGIQKKGPNLIPSIKSCYLGPVTMERIGNPNDNSIPEIASKLYDHVVYVFGEIDVRMHVKNRSSALKISAEKFIDERLVEKYLTKISKKRETSFCVHHVMSTVPPIQKDIYNSMISDEKWRITSSDEERAYYTKYMNSSLQRMCKEFKLEYFDVYSLYKGNDGMATADLQDKSGHISNIALVKKLLESKGMISGTT